MRCLLLAALLLFAPARPAGLVIHLEASAAVVAPDDSWTYTVVVARPMRVVDMLDTRIEPVSMSDSCTWDGVIAVSCYARPAEPLTITVRIRRNPCEPTLCRSREWDINNQVFGARGAVSEVVTVAVRGLGPAAERRPYAVWLPVIAGR